MEPTPANGRMSVQTTGRTSPFLSPPAPDHRMARQSTSFWLEPIVWKKGWTRMRSEWVFPHLDGHLNLALTERTTMPLTEASALAASWHQLKTTIREESEMPSTELMASGIGGRGQLGRSIKCST